MLYAPEQGGGATQPWRMSDGDKESRGPGPREQEAREQFRKTFFPESLCHDCAAPPRFIRNDRGSTFLLCPLWRRYPPQPVRSCELFIPLPGG